jgi:hypothetical protein
MLPFYAPAAELGEQPRRVQGSGASSKARRFCIRGRSERCARDSAEATRLACPSLKWMVGDHVKRNRSRASADCQAASDITTGQSGRRRFIFIRNCRVDIILRFVDKEQPPGTGHVVSLAERGRFLATRLENPGTCVLRRRLTPRRRLSGCHPRIGGGGPRRRGRDLPVSAPGPRARADEPGCPNDYWGRWTRTGVHGDPTKASAEKGRILFEAAVSGVVQLVDELRAWPIKKRQDMHQRPVQAAVRW